MIMKESVKLASWYLALILVILPVITWLLTIEPVEAG